MNEAGLGGFQDIGSLEDLTALAQGASAKYQKPHEAHYVRGEDPETGQNAGAILDASRGVGRGRRQTSAGWRYGRVGSQGKGSICSCHPATLAFNGHSLARILGDKETDE